MDTDEFGPVQSGETPATLGSCSAEKPGVNWSGLKCSGRFNVLFTDQVRSGQVSSDIQCESTQQTQSRSTRDFVAAT